MQRIEFDFVARRYHATPWDAHVNEGRVEWPPCPWRLIRALIAVGYNKLGWREVPEEANGLLKALAGCSPTFYLPTATETHTRHYMPVRDGKKERRSRIFDACLRFSSGQTRMVVEYDCKLTTQQRDLFRDLLEGMAYLGRAESWVDARLIDEHADTSDASADHENTALLHRISSDSVNPSSEIIRLLGPMDDENYSKWRAMESARVDEQATAEGNARSATKAAIKKAVAKAQAAYPKTLTDALQVETSDWQTGGWSRPPGSRWLDYRIPEGLYDNAPLRQDLLDSAFDPPQAILLAIDGQGKRGTLRPGMKRVLPLMELLHAKSIWYADKKLDADLKDMPELTGQGTDGKPLRKDHFHAHWIPLSLQQAGHIDHVLVISKRGFSKNSVKAISGLRTAYSKGIRKLGFNAVGQGSITEMYQKLSTLPDVATGSADLLSPGRVFESYTPLVFRKYTSNRGRKRIDNQIREELSERGLPAPVNIEFWPNSRSQAAGLKGFVLRRQPSKAQPPCERSWGVTITFQEAVETVPLALGYGSHLGLGLFRAVDGNR